MQKSTAKQDKAPASQDVGSFFRHSEKSLFATILICGSVLAGLAFLDSGQHGLSLVGLGMLLGMAFMGFQYGFASGWRRFLQTGDGSAVSLHFILAALCALVFIPVTASGL
ncbi:MAG: YeeE/YedE family protein, partial [Candidatus Puniceispirillum sp.]